MTSTCLKLNSIIWFENVSMDRTIKEDEEHLKIVGKKFLPLWTGSCQHTHLSWAIETLKQENPESEVNLSCTAFLVWEKKAKKEGKKGGRERAGRKL